MFSCEYSEIFKNSIFIKHLLWLYLPQTLELLGKQVFLYKSISNFSENH